MNDSDRVRRALDLEKSERRRAVEQINRDADKADKLVAANGAARGAISGRAIAKVQHDRAERIVEAYLNLRRQTLSMVPEVGTEEHFKELADECCRAIDIVTASLKDRMQHYGMRLGSADVPYKDPEADRLKGYARNEVDLLKQRVEFEREVKPVTVSLLEVKDKRKVWVVHGRNSKARDAMFTFLRAMNLEPMEWGEALALTGKATPYTGEVLDRAFAEAQAVVVLISGDDVARLGSRYVEASDPPEETDLTPQARPNVLFEAGMAFGRHPDRTILVQVGKTRPFSDVIGRNIVHISNDPKRRQGLADRLRTAGCDVKTDHRTQWQDAGDFNGAQETPDQSDEGD